MLISMARVYVPKIRLPARQVADMTDRRQAQTACCFIDLISFHANRHCHISLLTDYLVTTTTSKTMTTTTTMIMTTTTTTTTTTTIGATTVVTGGDWSPTFMLGTNNVLLPQFLAVVFKKQAISQQVVTRMQDLASEFSKIFREWYPRTLTAGGGDPLPHPTPRCWEPNLSPPQLFSGGCAPDDYNDDNKSSKLLVSLKVLNSRDD